MQILQRYLVLRAAGVLEALTVAMLTPRRFGMHEDGLRVSIQQEQMSLQCIANRSFVRNESNRREMRKMPQDSRC